jgi:hypothetical protein
MANLKYKRKADRLVGFFWWIDKKDGRGKQPAIL